jgi:hypothetical protein
LTVGVEKEVQKCHQNPASALRFHSPAVGRGGHHRIDWVTETGHLLFVGNIAVGNTKLGEFLPVWGGRRQPASARAVHYTQQISGEKNMPKRAALRIKNQEHSDRRCSRLKRSVTDRTSLRRKQKLTSKVKRYTKLMFAMMAVSPQVLLGPLLGS